MSSQAHDQNPHEEDSNELTIPFTRTDNYTVSEAINDLGNGLMQYILLFVIGIVTSVQAANIVIMSYLEPNVKCEWHLDEAKETMLSFVVFIGMALGSNFWGNLADVHGRKLITIASLATIAAAGVLTAASRSFLLLLLARGLVGLGIGGNSTCLSYYSEFLPTTVRGHSLSVFHLFWAVGAIAEAGLAWIFVPTYGWRWLALLTSVPAILILPIAATMPESPRYLVVAGRPDKAIRVLKRISRINNKTLRSLDIAAPSNNPTNDQHSSVISHFSKLFEFPLDRITPLIWFLAFTYGLGYYATVILASATRTDEETQCLGQEANMSSEDYMYILIDASAELPGVLLAFLTVERLGRVKSMIFSWGACGVSMSLLVLFPQWSTWFLFISWMFVAYTGIVIFILAPEVYPSSCRCFAMGSMSSISQMGGAASPFVARALFDTYGLKTVACLIASLFFLADLASFLLTPYETAGMAMKDDINEFTSDEEVEDLIEEISVIELNVP